MYGLGQHQHGLLDQKGAVIDLIQRNTEVCIPFVLSDRGYGLLWNMPGVGRVQLGANRTRWVADGAHQLDYWVTTGSTPADIVGRYSKATGLPPVLPSWPPAFGSASCATARRTNCSRWLVNTIGEGFLYQSSSSTTSIGRAKVSGSSTPKNGLIPKQWWTN